VAGGGAAAAPVGGGAGAAAAGGGGSAPPPGIGDGHKLGKEGKDWIRNLDPSTTIVCVSNPKNATTKSFKRYEDYKGATTIAEYKALHQGPNDKRSADLLNDVQHGYILISTAVLLNALEGSAVAPLLATTATPAPEVVGATASDGDAPEDGPGLLHLLCARHMPEHVAVHDFLDNMCLAAEEGFDAAVESEARIAGVSPEMYRIQQLEALEGGAQAPHLAGGLSAVDAFLEAAVGQMGQLFNLAAVTGEDENIKSIPDAQKSPAWDGDGGWKHCTKDELVRCIDVHEALVLRSKDYYDALLARLGKGKVHLKRLVIVFKQKWLAKNVPDRKKVRLTVGDLKVCGKVAYAPTVGYDSTRFRPAHHQGRRRRVLVRHAHPP